MSDCERNDLFVVLKDAVSKGNWLVVLICFIISILIFSDVFVENVLSKIDGATVNDTPTNKGTLLQLIVVSFSYLLIDMLKQYGVI